MAAKTKKGCAGTKTKQKKNKEGSKETEQSVGQSSFLMYR